MSAIDFTQERPPEQRFRTLLRAYSHKPKNKFGDPEFVFMHVGKTGGTSINVFFKNCHNAGLRVPIVLNHNWSFRMARSRYPKAKIIVILRDPLERAISGFNSRLREGRPLGHPWRTDEAIAFSHFKSTETFADALSSDEPYQISAARFCFRCINHLRRGYRHQFGDLERAPGGSDGPLLVIELENIGHSMPPIIGALNPKRTHEIPNLGTIHKATISSSSFLDGLSEENIRKIRGRMEMEYESYHILKTYLGNS